MTAPLRATSLAAVGLVGLVVGFWLRPVPRPETRFLNFDEESTPDGVLGPTWAGPERDGNGETFMWCAARRCDVTIKIGGGGDRLIRMRTWPYQVPDGPEQKLTLLVDDVAIETRVMHGAHTVESFVVPGERLHVGRNTLGFDFSFVASPRDTNPADGDARTLSAAFDWIEIVPVQR